MKFRILNFTDNNSTKSFKQTWMSKIQEDPEFQIQGARTKQPMSFSFFFFFFWFFNGYKVERITGVDLVFLLCIVTVDDSVETILN